VRIHLTRVARAIEKEMARHVAKAADSAS